jgi:hypothetical protein
MRKTTPAALIADWSVISPRAPWQHVTSMELSRVLGVHLQTINNWRIRGILPDPAPHSKQLRGNKNYFRIGAIRAWLEGGDEKEITREWLQQQFEVEYLTDAQVAYLSTTINPQRFLSIL